MGRRGARACELAIFEGRLETTAGFANFAHRGVIFRAQAAGAVGEDVAHDPDAVANVIENDQAQIKHHHGVVRAQIVLGAVWDALKQAHHVVGEVADGARHQRRQAGQAHRAVALNAIAQEVERDSIAPRRRGSRLPARRRR